MKKVLSLVLTLVFTITLFQTQIFANTETMYYGKIVEVKDGSTFVLQTIDNELQTYILAGADLSETPDAYNLLDTLINGKNVRVYSQNVANTNYVPYSYGRIVLDNEDINALLLKSGYAFLDVSTISPINKYSYVRYENRAKYYDQGIWHNYTPRK